MAQILCLHSSQSSGAQWRPLLSAFKDSAFAHSFLTPDLIGYGRTPATEAVQHAEQFRLQHEVDALSERLDDAPLHIVGHSYGGALALRLARLLGDRVQSLSLYEPVAFHVLPAEDPARAEIVGIAEKMQSLSTAEAAQAFVDYWNYPGYFAALPARVQQGMVDKQSKVQADFAALLQEPASLEDYQQIACPVLLLHGAQSPLSSRRVASLLQTTLPRVHSGEIDAGHMAPLTHPHLVMPRISEFLQSLLKAIA